MEIGLDQHAELVGDISSAASKELAIEQVRVVCMHLPYVHVHWKSSVVRVTTNVRMSSRLSKP